jgi:hypothetical protein
VRSAIVAVIAVASIASCGALDVLGKTRSSASFGPEGPSPKEASDYCARFREDASGRAQADMYGAYFFGLAAVAATATAPILVADTGSGTASGTRRALEAASPIAAGAFTYIARALVSRESAASALAKQATLALTDKTPSAAVDSCNKALASWDAARDDATKIASDLQEDDAVEKAQVKSEAKALVKSLPTDMQLRLQKEHPKLLNTLPVPGPQTPNPTLKPQH